MRRTNWVKRGLYAGVMLWGAAAVAQAPSPRPERAQREVVNDAQFLTRALRTNQLELRLGKMAAERASTPEVRAMGAKMVQKHTELGQQLQALAQPAGVPGNPDWSLEEQATFTRLASLSGNDFDKSFKQTIDAGHVEELAMYRDEMNRAASPELRALVQKRVAALEQAVSKAQPRGQW